MIRSFSKEQSNPVAAAAVEQHNDYNNVLAKYKNLRKIQSHSRNNSNDINFESRQKFAHHSRTNSRDDAAFNIKYIQNQLKQSIEDDDELTAGCGHFVKKHSRNHSYDQIYMPNNIRFDADFFRGRKNVNLLKNVVESKVKNSNETDAATRGHSRNSSKDLNLKSHQHQQLTMTLPPPSLTVTSATGMGSNAAVETAFNILRHRRTNSKDLNIIAYSSGSDATCSPAISSNLNCNVNVVNSAKHSRSSSHHKIQIDDDRNGLINNNDDEEDDAETMRL